jgi:hypothetical protein
MTEWSGGMKEGSGVHPTDDGAIYGYQSSANGKTTLACMSKTGSVQLAKHGYLTPRIWFLSLRGQIMLLFSSILPHRETDFV